MEPEWKDYLAELVASKAFASFPSKMQAPALIQTGVLFECSRLFLVGMGELATSWS